MTLEELKAELAKRGCNRQTIEAKVLPVALDIMSGGGDFYQRSADAEHELEELEAKVERERQELANLEAECQSQKQVLQEIHEDARQVFSTECRKSLEYIDRFLQSIQECETPEGLDLMRRAQAFINAVQVDTKYDNTAFITGLGAILAGPGISAIQELKKINPELFGETALRDETALTEKLDRPTVRWPRDGWRR